jgi:hypothetical protein
LDNHISLYIAQFELTDEWVNSYIASKDCTLFTIQHPEVIFFKNQIINNFLFDFLADISVSSYQYVDSQSLTVPMLLFIDYIFLIYASYMLMSFLFSSYSNVSKEESNIDADYLSASLTIESEKEVGSLDDISMLIVVLAYVFG